MSKQSRYVLIEDAPTSRVIVAERIDDGVAYSSRGATVERFKHRASFRNVSGGIVSLIIARDAAMKWIRQQTDLDAGNAEREREAGS